MIENKKMKEVLGKDNTTAIRGIAIIMVIIHHYSQYYAIPSALKVIFDQFGYLAVGLFFVLSGYGNIISYKKQQFSIKNSLSWLGKRIIHIYVSFWLVLVSSYFFLWLAGGMKWNMKVAIMNCFTLTLPDWTNWYLKIQILLYILFVLTECLFRKAKYASFFIAALLLVYIVCARHLGMMNFWWNTVLCYPLGVFIAESKQYGNSEKYMKICVIASLFVFLGATYMKQYNNLFGVLASACFCIVVLYFNTLHIIDGKVLGWIGKMSLEIYMTHLIVIRILLARNVSKGPALVLIFAGALIYAMAIHKIVDVIFRKGKIHG